MSVGGIPAMFIVNSDAQVTFEVPDGFTGGDVTVTSPQGSGSYHLNLFSVSSVSPWSGQVGDTVTINGTGLDSVTHVYFKPASGAGARVEVTQFNASGSTLTFPVPSGIAADSKIEVSVGDQPVTLSGTFRLATVPHIQSLGVPAVAPGQWVEVFGNGFTGVTGVTVGGRPADFSYYTDSELIVTVPNGFTAGDLTVTTPLGSDSYTLKLFSITSSTPTSGGVGDTITINGTGLSGVTDVTFLPVDFSSAGVAATQVTIVNDNQITVVVPPGTPAVAAIAISQNHKQTIYTPQRFTLR